MRRSSHLNEVQLQTSYHQFESLRDDESLQSEEPKVESFATHCGEVDTKLAKVTVLVGEVHEKCNSDSSATDTELQYQMEAGWLNWKMPRVRRQWRFQLDQTFIPPAIGW